MFIQGNLQDVFDALYTMGIIDPALKADWSVIEKDKKRKSFMLKEMIQIVNKCESHFQIRSSSIGQSNSNINQALSNMNDSSKEKIDSLVEELKVFDRESLLFLAMEVAREFVEYEERKSVH